MSEAKKRPTGGGRVTGGGGTSFGVQSAAIERDARVLAACGLGLQMRRWNTRAVGWTLHLSGQKLNSPTLPSFCFSGESSSRGCPFLGSASISDTSQDTS